jgi:hypothetical protein
VPPRPLADVSTADGRPTRLVDAFAWLARSVFPSAETDTATASSGNGLAWEPLNHGRVPRLLARGRAFVAAEIVIEATRRGEIGARQGGSARHGINNRACSSMTCSKAACSTFQSKTRTASTSIVGAKSGRA